MAQESPAPDTFDVSSGAQPSLLYRILFFLLLSGPPKFRLRDPSESLGSVIDWAVALQVIVWGVAGCWLLLDRSYDFDNDAVKRPRWSSLQILIFIFILLLALSVCFSEAPALSAFKVYQLAVTVAFVMRFTRRFGVEQTLNNLFVGCGILTLADIAAALLMPSLVFVQTELGGIRFRGDLIAQTGSVSIIGLILLLTIKSDLPWKKLITWGAIFGGVLVFSLMRTSYIILLVVLLLAAFRRPAIPLLRKAAILILLVVPFVADLLITALNAERKAEDVLTLSGRIGLWTHLLQTTLDRGPWLGLGYFAASRIYAPEFNADLGTAHSAFLEVYVGGGLVTLIVFLLIWILVGWQVLKLYLSRPGKTGFAIVALFCAALFLNGIGGELQAESSGFCFWCVVMSVIFLPFESVSSTPAATSSAEIGPLHAQET